MTRILARCTRCYSEFPLFAVAEEGTRACPHCWQPLVAGDPGALLEWAAVADAAQYRLCAAVYLLQQVGGDLVVGWPSVLQSLAEEAGGKPLAVVPNGASKQNGETRLGTPHRRETAEPHRFRRPPLRMEWRRVGSDCQ